MNLDQVLGQRTRLAFLDTRAASEALPRVVEVKEHLVNFGMVKGSAGVFPIICMWCAFSFFR